MCVLGFSQKEPESSNKRDVDKMSITESLTGTPDAENPDEAKSERLKEKYGTD